MNRRECIDGSTGGVLGGKGLIRRSIEGMQEGGVNRRSTGRVHEGWVYTDYRSAVGGKVA
jgi:hypothetical protein